MPTKKPAPKATSAEPNDPDAVAQFMRDLEHPLKPGLAVVRATIMGSSREITEAIKWKVPSFYFKNYFATISIGRKTRAQPSDHILVILHRGVKVKHDGARTPISDPGGLLEWLAPDRCAVRFHGVNDVEAKREALESIVRQWLKGMS